jgi:hypothetical protein
LRRIASVRLAILGGSDGEARTLDLRSSAASPSRWLPDLVEHEHRPADGEQHQEQKEHDGHGEETTRSTIRDSSRDPEAYKERARDRLVMDGNISQGIIPYISDTPAFESAEWLGRVGVQVSVVESGDRRGQGDKNREHDEELYE